MRRLLLCLLLIGPAVAQPVALPRAAAPLPLIDFRPLDALSHWTGLKVTAATLDGQPGFRFTFPQWARGQNEWPAVYGTYDAGGGFVTRDWSHYAYLAFDATTDSDQPENLSVELRAVAGRNGRTIAQPIAPGKVNHLRYALGDYRGEMRLDDIQQIVFYTSRPPRSYTVTVANLRLLPGEREPLATLDLAYPNYRQLIFPAVDRAAVEVTVHPEEYGVAPADLTAELVAEGGGRTARGQAKLDRVRATVTVPTGGLPAGPLRLRCRVLGPAGEVATGSWEATRLTAAEAKALRVYVDADNNTIVDGKPFFPLGWYGNGTPGHAAELADSPFNCLLDCGATGKSKAQMTAYLDQLQKLGLHLIYCMNDVYPSAPYGRTFEGLKTNNQVADAVVQAFRDHPALLAWYLNDERPRSMVPEFTEYYQRVRRLDPNHPCYIVLADMADLVFYRDTTDVMGVDPYPIPRLPVTLTSYETDAGVASVGGHKPVWVVPQAFGWYQYQPEGSKRDRVPTEQELKTGRAPTYEESRCMTYLALAHGAKGLIYYSYYDMHQLPQYATMWAGMKRIAGEVKTLTPVLLSPDDLGPVPFTPANAPIHTELKRQNGRLTLVTVNAGSQACEVTFTLPHGLPAQVPVQFEDRTVKAAGATLSDSFKPLEVHVYDLGRG